MDWDNDGLQDLVVGDGPGFVHLYLNEGTGNVPELDPGSNIDVGGVSINVGGRAAPVVDDWNGDGKKDLLVGNFDGNIKVYLNEGDDAAPLFNSSYNLTFSSGEEVKVGTRVAPRIFDWDRDGLKDLLIGEFEGYIFFLRNMGTNNNPVFERSEKLLLTTGEPLLYSGKRGGHRARLTVTDWNNDGIHDILAGGTDGRVMIFAGAPEPLLISMKDRFWLTKTGERIQRRWRRFRGADE